jgi:hypothetical protein
MACACAALVMRAYGETISIGASKDTTLIQDPLGSLSDGGDSGLFIGNPSSTHRTLIAFDVASALPAGATINSATLTLNLDRSHAFDAEMTVSRLTKNWGEGTTVGAGGGGGGGAGGPAGANDATWIYNFYNTSSWTNPGAEGDYLSPSGTFSGLGNLQSYDFNSAGMATDVASWLSNPSTNFGWILKADDSFGGMRFQSRENANTAGRPLLTIDYSVTSGISGSWKNDADGNYSSGGNWSGSVPIGANATATFGNVISQARQVTIDTPLSVKSINFDSASRYTLAGTSTLTIDSSSTGAINVISGSHTISAPLALAKSTTVTVTPATSTLTISGNFTASTGATLTKAGAGMLEIWRTAGDGLSIGAGVVRLLPNASAASNVQSLSITAGAGLDMTNNALVIDYTGASILPAVQSQIVGGFHGGDWLGSGITSSTAATIAVNASNAHKTALGYADASALFAAFPQSFKGQSIDATSMLIRYTYAGDANLDGKVNALDFNALASGFGTGSTWLNGDFDYDGAVTSADFSALATNFNLSLSAPALGTPVPEPTLVFFVTLPALLCPRRRRHQLIRV